MLENTHTHKPTHTQPLSGGPGEHGSSLGMGWYEEERRLFIINKHTTHDTRHPRETTKRNGINFDVVSKKEDIFLPLFVLLCFVLFCFVLFLFFCSKAIINNN